jgi:hypothetical protein
LQATGKVWTKKQLQEKWKKMILGDKRHGDAKRLRKFTNCVMETGNLAAPPPFVPTPADDIEPGRVDPRILTGKDPVFDKHSLVTVEAGSCFSSGQELSGIGVSRVASKPPRFAPTATATSEACESQLERAAAQPTNTSQHESSADDPGSLVEPEPDLEPQGAETFGRSQKFRLQLPAPGQTKVVS